MIVAMVQGVYFAVTGAWSIVSPGTFQAVTGPKRDIWLLKTVGVLVVVVGAALFVAGVRDEIDAAIAVLGIGSAAGLTAIDVWYTARRVISPIYLLDAVAELLLVAWWVLYLVLR